MKNEKFFRYLNFDLSDDLLKQYYPKKNIRQAWDDIGKYLIKNNFTHRQFSAYLSNNKMTEIELLKVAGGMFQKMPWILQCAKKFDATTIYETFDILKTFSVDKKFINLLQENQMQNKTNPPEKNQGDFSLEQSSDKSKMKKEITQPVKKVVTLEQAVKMKRTGIPFAIMGGDNKNVVTVFDKSNIEKVKQITNPSVKKSKNR